MLEPWSSLRSLDFHSFKSALRRFCFAYDCTFSPPHSLPCLALSVGELSTSHYIFSFVVFYQSNELHPTDKLGSISREFSLKRKKFYSFYKKKCNSASKYRNMNSRRFVDSNIASGSEAERQVLAGCTIHSSVGFWGHRAFITFSRVKDHA